jgi:4-carboxymuconolactone decarboxylase
MTDRYDDGLALRKQVLGEAPVSGIVERAKGAFNETLQEHLTSFVWGDIWSREGLALRERSLITLAMLIPLNRQTEFKTHVRGAFNNGVTPEELHEVMLHAAAYCGFPAAMTAFRLAKEVFDEMAAAKTRGT